MTSRDPARDYLKCCVPFFSYAISSSVKCTVRDYIPYSAGIDFSRQNLTSVDVRILTTKVDLRTVRINIFLMVVDP